MPISSMFEGNVLTKSVVSQAVMATLFFATLRLGVNQFLAKAPSRKVRKKYLLFRDVSCDFVDRPSRGQRFDPRNHTKPHEKKAL